VIGVVAPGFSRLVCSLPLMQVTRFGLIKAEREFIHCLLRDGRITDETRRRIERDLDLEEASLANREYRGPL